MAKLPPGPWSVTVPGILIFLRLQTVELVPQEEGGVGLVMTLVQQSPRACKSPGAGQGGTRQRFLLKRQRGRELSPLIENSHQLSSQPLPFTGEHQKLWGQHSLTP